MCRFLCGAQQLIWMDKKRLHSFFSFKVNSSTSCSRLSYRAGVSPQKLSMPVTWQWIWEDSLTHLKAKDTALRGFHTEKCVCACVRTPYTIYGLFQYTCNLVLCPLLWEVFWMRFKCRQTYRRCSTNKISLKYNYREKTQQFLPITLSSLCRIHLGKPTARDHTVRDPIVSKGQKSGCCGNLNSKFPEFRKIKISVFTSY